MAGGLTKGKSHAKGGIKMKVKSTGQNIEVEGGEGIINKYVMSDDKKYSYEGKKMTACEIASDLNQKTGNGVSFDCNETKKTDMTPTDPSTGFSKGGKTKKRKYKKMAKKGNKGAFAKLVSKIMKRDGIPYKQAQKKAKDEYVSGTQKKKGEKKTKKSYKGRMETLKGKSKIKKIARELSKGSKVHKKQSEALAKASSKHQKQSEQLEKITSKMAKGGELMDADTEFEYAKGGEIQVVDELNNMNLPKDIYSNGKIYKGKAIFINGYNGYTSTKNDGYLIDEKGNYLTDEKGNNLVAKERRGVVIDLSKYAKGGMIRIESGNKGKTRVVYNKKKDAFTELQANEIYDNEKAKGKSVFIFVDDELFDSYIADGDEDMYAKGGELMSRESIVEILKDRLEPVADEIESDFETYNNNGEEVEYQSRDGFIPFTDGGYEYDLFTTMSMLISSGKSLPTQALDDELERQDNYSYELAQEDIFNTYSDDEDFIERFPSKEDIDYSDLYDYDDIIAEEFDSYRFDSDDSVLFGVSAYYYKPDNYRGVEGSHSIRLTGYVNLESPYHRRGRLEDGKEILFTFDSLKQLEYKLAINILKIMEWFKGKEYDLSTKSLYAKGGQTKKFNNGGNIMEKKEEFMRYLERQIPDIDFSSLDLDEINSYDELTDALYDGGYFDQEVIYYSSAMDYLREEDPSLSEALELAGDMGYDAGSLNSEILASILKSERVKDEYFQMSSEIEDFFDELED